MINSLKSRIPNKPNRNKALLLAIIVLFLSIILYVIKSYGSPLVMGVLGLILGSLISLTIPIYRWAPIYILRLVLIGSPGLLSGLIILVNEPGVNISAHAVRYQTYEIALKVIIMTVMAMSASAIGWGLSVGKVSYEIKNNYSNSFSPRFIAYGLIAIIAGTLVSKAAGPFVWVAAYTTAAEPTLLNIGVYPALVVIGVLGMYSIYLFDSCVSTHYKTVFWFIAFYSLIICMLLRGMRLEVVAAFIAIYFLRFEKNLNVIRPIRLLFFGILLYLLIQIWGVYRSLADSGLSLSDSASIAISSVKTSNELGALVYNLGTMGDIAATFYNAVGMMDDHILKLIYGQSYLDYIPRTLPEVIYPNRPEDLAWIFEKYGESSGGGIFELAEAFINFGTIGVIFIPGILTFIFGRVYIMALTNRTPLYFMAYAVVLSLFIRGIWYQTFAMYKTIIVWFLVECFILVFTEFNNKHQQYVDA